MSWDDQRFNGLRTSLRESRNTWVDLRDMSEQQGMDLSFQKAAGQVNGLETALRLLDTWVLAIQEEEKTDEPES